MLAVFVRTGQQSLSLNSPGSQTSSGLCGISLVLLNMMNKSSSSLSSISQCSLWPREKPVTLWIHIYVVHGFITVDCSISTEVLWSSHWNLLLHVFLFAGFIDLIFTSLTFHLWTQDIFLVTQLTVIAPTALIRQLLQNVRVFNADGSASPLIHVFSWSKGTWQTLIKALVRAGEPPKINTLPAAQQLCVFFGKGFSKTL